MEPTKKTKDFFLFGSDRRLHAKNWMARDKRDRRVTVWTSVDFRSTKGMMTRSYLGTIYDDIKRHVRSYIVICVGFNALLVLAVLLSLRLRYAATRTFSPASTSGSSLFAFFPRHFIVAFGR